MPSSQTATHNTESAKYANRPPIVVVLGHVDHGKTSILDKIRKTKVAEKESGGITQHIGAYQAEHNGKRITFIDTPGHEAFSAIRSRGAKVADIAVVVIAAEEGIKPQTKEAIQIAKDAKIPFVVAINKIDKDGANPQRARQELAENEVMVEDYGGTIPVIELSAKTGQGINELLEMILLVAEMEELQSPIGPLAKGIVIETHKDAQRGQVATLIVQEGEFKVGDWVVAGKAIGRAKRIEDFTGTQINVVIASQPCLMSGWEQLPPIGQEFQTVLSRGEAEKLASRVSEIGPAQLFTKETSTEEVKTNKKIAKLIIKADVVSSLEAIEQTLKPIKNEEVAYEVIGHGIGNINDTDIKNAATVGASAIGFHVNVEPSAQNLAEKNKIKAKTFEIIYELVEMVRDTMSDLLEPEIKKIPLGKLRVLATFKGTTKSQVVGGRVTQGKLVRGAMIDVMRGGAVFTTGRLGQLQQNKNDVAEVVEGLECGIRFDAPQQQTGTPSLIKEGDVLEIFQEERIKRTV
ncbi:MAG: translation initiation factor IF-2 [Candidatus Yanofskybacteria bacterium]|nr:translation initiation factor IF-2 [Candidatus Yanofskybacteria bacterium]